MRKRLRNNRTNLIIAVILLLTLITVSGMSMDRIRRLEERECITRLHEEGEEVAREVKMRAINDRRTLEVMAKHISEFEDYQDAELWNIMHSYLEFCGMTEVAILMPDNTAYHRVGDRIERSDASAELDFNELLAKGKHISDKQNSLSFEGEHVIRHFVPVYANGEPKAILYGTVDFRDLPNRIEVKPYDGEAHMYVIDAKTGDFLLNTRDNAPNLWDLGDLNMKRGYSNEQMREEIEEGKSSYIVFTALKSRNVLYFSYQPTGVNEWRVALSVHEDVVLRKLRKVSAIMHLTLFFEVVCAMIFFMWTMHYFKQDNEEKERQLKTINYIYDVEKLLFTAHENPDNIYKAMEKIAYMTSAEIVAFWLKGTGNLEDDRFYLLKDGKANVYIGESETQMKTVQSILEYFKHNNNEILAYSTEDIAKIMPKEEADRSQRLMSVPAVDEEGNICGVLSAINFTDENASPALLKSVSLSFGMFCRNINTYNALKEQGEKDMLTGLYNRNRYEMDCVRCKELYENSLSCIYMDANGLHEINNTQGHEAGDKMLKTIAKWIMKVFGVRSTYRIGGDEFLVFAPDISEAELRHRCHGISMRLQEDGYHISCGTAVMEGEFDVEELVKTAETHMYADKRRYYSRHARKETRTSK